MIIHIKELVKEGKEWQSEKQIKAIALNLHEKCGIKGKFKACRQWCGNTKQLIIKELEKDGQDDDNNKNDDDNNLMEKEGVTLNKETDNDNDEDKDDGGNASDVNMTDGLDDDEKEGVTLNKETDNDNDDPCYLHLRSSI